MRRESARKDDDSNGDNGGDNEDKNDDDNDHRVTMMMIPMIINVKTIRVLPTIRKLITMIE